MAALGAGDEAVAAPGSLHAGSNPGEQRSVAQVELRPGSPGFQKGLRVAYGLAADGRVLKNGVSRNPLQASLLLEMGEVRMRATAWRAAPAGAVGPLTRICSGERLVARAQEGPGVR
jgi:hypothetical protein